MNKLTRWDHFLGLFGIKTTWTWCVVGYTFGRHIWSVSEEKCRNGVPIISGGSITVYTCSDEESAKDLCAAFQPIAAKLNLVAGYEP